MPRGIFGMRLVLVVKWSAESWFKRHSPLNAALGDGQESSLFASSWFSLSIRFSKSAIWYCRLKSLNISNRKTCQSSWVASLVFSAGWWRVLLAQSVAKAS